MTATSCLTKEKHECHYLAITIDEVTEVVARSIYCYTFDCCSFDKVSDSPDEVRLLAKPLVPITNEDV